MSTFRQFLSEGMIKLPPNLAKQMERSFLTNYLAWVQDKVDDLEGKEYDAANKTLKKYLAKYDIDIEDINTEAIGKKKLITDSFKLDINEFPYIAKLKKMYRDYKALNTSLIHLALDFAGTKSNGKYNVASQTITLYIKKLRLDDPLSNLEQVLNRNIKVSLGVLEHELTHAVQFMILRHFHSQQVHANTDDIVDEDLYYTSKVEFDPMIKTQVTRFRAFASDMKRLSKDYDPYLSMKVVVGAMKVTPTDEPKVLFTKPSLFFATLKRKNPTLWKKAVKLFYQSINS